MSNVSRGFNLTTAKPVAEREDEGQTIHLRDERGELMYYAVRSSAVEGQSFDDLSPREIDQLVKDGILKPVTARIAGTYSNIFRRAQENQRNRMLRTRKASLTSEMVLQNQLELTAACVLGWDGFFNGEREVPFTPDNVLSLIEVAPWIRDQLEEAMNDHAGFSKSN